MGTDALNKDWYTSNEYFLGRQKYFDRIFAENWDVVGSAPTPEGYEQSQEYRDARLVYRKRVNGGFTKGNH